jgi:hypothetical protein
VRRVYLEFSAVKCRKKAGGNPLLKLTSVHKYDMLNVWISLWITVTSLCKTNGLSHCPQGIESFYDKKTYPISYPFKNPPYGGFFTLVIRFSEIRF